MNHVQHISLRIVLDRIGCRIILCTLTNIVECLQFVAVLMFRVVFVDVCNLGFSAREFPSGFSGFSECCIYFKILYVDLSYKLYVKFGFGCCISFKKIVRAFQYKLYVSNPSRPKINSYINFRVLVYTFPKGRTRTVHLLVNH